MYMYNSMANDLLSELYQGVKSRHPILGSFDERLKEKDTHAVLERNVKTFYDVFSEEIEAGISKLEPIKKPNKNLSLWDDEADVSNHHKSGKELINQTFGLFSKLTKVIQDNLVDPAIVESRSFTSGLSTATNNGDSYRYHPELALERPEIILSDPVTLEQFEYFTQNKNFKMARNHIFKGGLTEEARPAAWAQLLGVSNTENQIEKYLNLRSQWENLTPEQENLCSLLRERRSLIGKDVIRTDPTRLEVEQVQRLTNLLTTYCIFDQDLGYVQGMSDIAVVILDHYPDDCEAFWVYTRFMQRIRGNFEMSQKAIKQQFEALRRILAFTDGAMIRFLDKIDSGHMYFTFPWLLIIFRRVATLETLPLMWDVWLTSPCSNFHLIIAAAILDIYREEIIHEDNGYCEVLQIVNRLNGAIDTNEVLARAQSILVQIENCISTPPVIKQLLDLA